MANTGNDGQRKLCAVYGQVVRVEASQIGCSSTTTYNYHHIKEFNMLVYFFQCRNDGSFGLIALHDRRKELVVKGKMRRIVIQLVAKIAITGSCSGRNDSQPLWKFGKIEL